MELVKCHCYGMWVGIVYLVSRLGKSCIVLGSNPGGGGSFRKSTDRPSVSPASYRTGTTSLYWG